jgi:hypothetical protein
MNMKWFTFSIAGWLLFSATSAPAQAIATPEQQDTLRVSRYDKRVHIHRSRWEKMIPTHSKLQFAGNMGFLSLGLGWDYGKQRQWETDWFVGVIPKSSSARSKVVTTLKQNYIPWSVQISDGFSVEPLSCGLYITSVFGEEFWTKQPNRYPKGYYNFSTKIQPNVFVGQRLTYKVKHSRIVIAKEVTFFYELSTDGFSVVSAATNSYLRPVDYLHLSFGLKFQGL